MYSLMTQMHSERRLTCQNDVSAISVHFLHTTNHVTAAKQRAAPCFAMHRESRRDRIRAIVHAFEAKFP